MIQQRTLQSPTRAVGVGLHSGQRVEMLLQPAPVNTGIVFRRVDLSPTVDIPVTALSVTDTRMASTISQGIAKVQTVEHLMAAFCGLGVDNCVIDINADEVPILDGSAASYVYLLQSAGIVMQDTPRRFIRVLKPIEVREGEGNTLKWARLEPNHGYKLTFDIAFGHPAIDATGQRAEFDFSSSNFSRDLARARTFGFTRDVETLRLNGLALGSGLDNAIAMDDYKVLNSSGLRYSNEFAKHKLLDALGDLYTVGHPLLAVYSAFRSGHALNNKLLRLLLDTPGAHEIVSFDDAREAPAGFEQLAPAW